MITEYYRIVRDFETWNSHISTIRITSNRLGKRHAEFVGQSKVPDYWRGVLKNIEAGMAPDEGKAILKCLAGGGRGMTDKSDMPSINVIDRDGNVLHSVPLTEQDLDGNWNAADVIQKAIDWVASHHEIGPKIELPNETGYITVPTDPVPEVYAARIEPPDARPRRD